MNAIHFLLNEHEKMRHALAEISNSSHKYKTKKKMFDALGNDLLIHETIEETIWYPHFKNNKKINSTVKHLISEEKHAEQAINALDKITSEKEWDIKFSKFKENVEHHAAEEEEELFPLVEEILNPLELEKIGSEMRSFKKQLHEKQLRQYAMASQH